MLWLGCSAGDGELVQDSGDESDELLPSCREGPVIRASGQPQATIAGPSIVYRRQSCNIGPVDLATCFVSGKTGARASWRLVGEEVKRQGDRRRVQRGL